MVQGNELPVKYVNAKFKLHSIAILRECYVNLLSASCLWPAVA